MAQTIKVVLSILGALSMSYALVVGFWTDWLLSNISQSLFYIFTCTLLYAGALSGVFWILRKRDVDTMFAPSTALSLALALGLSFARVDTTMFFGPSDLSLALVLCLAFSGAVHFALAMTLRTTVKRKRKPH